jgi:hypothetical protein
VHEELKRGPCKWGCRASLIATMSAALGANRRQVTPSFRGKTMTRSVGVSPSTARAEIPRGGVLETANDCLHLNIFII